MARIKLNLRQLSVTEKIAKVKQIVAALTGNPSFPTPTPALPTVTTATNELEAAVAVTQAARQSVKTATSDQNAKEDVIDQLVTQLSGYVESIAGLNDSLIHSAGMDTRATPSASTVPDVPQALSATAGDHEGACDLSWDPVAQGKSYMIEMCVDPSVVGHWQHAGVSTKSTSTVSGLTSGTRYWFRVAAVGAGGQSGWSDPATRIAP